MQRQRKNQRQLVLKRSWNSSVTSLGPQISWCLVFKTTLTSRLRRQAQHWDETQLTLCESVHLSLNDGSITDAYYRQSRISRLPEYLVVHMVRFYWRRDIQWVNLVVFLASIDRLLGKRQRSCAKSSSPSNSTYLTLYVQSCVYLPSSHTDSPILFWTGDRAPPQKDPTPQFGDETNPQGTWCPCEYLET